MRVAEFLEEKACNANLPLLGSALFVEGEHRTALSISTYSIEFLFSVYLVLPRGLDPNCGFRSL